MSLLLDALKKAAEQKEKKAEASRAKNSQDAGDIGASDETKTELIDRDDNTEVSEVNYTKAGMSDDGGLISDQTGFDVVEDTQVVAIDETEYDSTQIDATVTQRLEEETIFVEREDDEDAVEMTQFLNELDQDGEDDTQVMSGSIVDEAEKEDQTEIVEATLVDPDVVDDHTVDYSESTVVIETGDQTEMPSFDEDETMSLLSNEDVSDFMGGRANLRSAASTDSAESTESTVVSSDDTEMSAQQVLTTEIDDDLSLNLVEQNPSDDTTATNPHTRDAESVLDGANLDTDGLSLVDDPHQTIGVDQTSTITANQDATVTSGIELESLRSDNTVIRQDSTSTNTYAPDNYDRTLIRPINDDASKIFAGMKSEEDVLMTPDYAKRVFLSKSSANRIQYYKLYLGIAVTIILAIGVYALFEFQDETNRIDTALMPLKQDPMPGIIKNFDDSADKDLFKNSIEPDIDSKTLKLIENAQLAVVETDIDEGLEAATEVEIVEQVSQEKPVVESIQPVENDAMSYTDEMETQKNQAVAKLEITNPPVQRSDKNQQDVKTTGSLKISSKQEFTEKDQWLSEAYQAYQNGNDAGALKKYNQVLEVEPKNRNALLARAAISVQNNNIAAAIADYQQLLLDNPKDSLALSSLISVANFSPEESETQIKLLLREEPDSPYLNFVLANIYGSQSRWQEAQGLYFKALENNPDDPNYAYNLAVSLEHISKPKVAIGYYEKAIMNIDNGLATFNKDVVDHRLEMLRQL